MRNVFVFSMSFVVALMVAGCASTSGSSISAGNAEGEIGAVLNEWKAAFEKGDVDAMMAVFSDDFKHYEWDDKEGMTRFLKDAKSEGELNNGEVDLQSVEYSRNKNGSWNAYPIDIEASFGSTTMEATLKKEGVAWKIIHIDVTGI